MKVRFDGAGIFWESPTGRSLRVWSHWLRILVVEANLYVAESKAWTDGANFHPQRVLFDADSHLRSAAVSADELVVGWDDGFTGAVPLQDLEDRITGDPLGALRCSRSGSNGWRIGSSR